MVYRLKAAVVEIQLSQQKAYFLNYYGRETMSTCGYLNLAPVISNGNGLTFIDSNPGQVSE